MTIKEIVYCFISCQTGRTKKTLINEYKSSVIVFMSNMLDGMNN